MPAKKVPASAPTQPVYISLADAIRLMDGVVSRSEFFERYRHDEAIIRRLDIRRNPEKARSLSCNRSAVLVWIEELRSGHERALAPDPNAANLGKHARRRAIRADDSFGEQLAALCRAREAGRISETEFQRAKRDLAG